MTPANRYLNELIDYGGESWTRAEAIVDQGYDRPMASRLRTGTAAARPAGAGSSPGHCPAGT